MNDNKKNTEKKQFNARVLLVEDVPMNQKVATGILKRNGCTVDLAVNGEEAVMKCGKTSYDLILMDVQMPVMDGIQATRKIRGNETNVIDPGVPIIAMTANAMKGDRELCLKAGMDDYVSKPIRADELKIAIENQLVISNTKPRKPTRIESCQK